MLEILLLILRIAGIIFVSVLGILIVVICFALFVPVRYRGDFSVSDGENGEKEGVCGPLRHLVSAACACVCHLWGDGQTAGEGFIFYVFGYGEGERG